MTGLEPARFYPVDSESTVSAYSTTSAYINDTTHLWFEDAYSTQGTPTGVHPVTDPQVTATVVSGSLIFSISSVR